uniref:Uncharacterized protein n=1 Tax=Chromera velia CCMP2878 TaxID=1169474 RepID=A0A0G4F9Q4_9ALVE|eukprot:Cvel_15900.t1-p1 / transcript=Cvel_15900.t1 / gene=Cvel_15900 / organism=Chromera_velia_CCMP2878 / gene_product=hypothetical protein / transcript_product=hypothetical protein / location=Cvel_scaffold1201:24835-40201(+) / protein_length=382 / sequence_SO=supercontig / SO=protein_coding / is_pseudo=false
MPVHNTRLVKAKAKALANAVAKAKAKGLAKAAAPKPKAKAKSKAKAKAKAALPLAAPSDSAQPNANQNEDPHADGEAVGQNPQAEHPDVQIGVAAPANPNLEEEKEVQEVPMNEGEQQGASRHNDEPPRGPPPQSVLSSIDLQFLRDLQTQGFIFRLDGQGNVVPVRMDTNYSPDIPETPTRHHLGGKGASLSVRLGGIPAWVGGRLSKGGVESKTVPAFTSGLARPMLVGGGIFCPAVPRPVAFVLLGTSWEQEEVRREADCQWQSLLDSLLSILKRKREEKEEAGDLLSDDDMVGNAGIAAKALSALGTAERCRMGHLLGGCGGCNKHHHITPKQLHPSLWDWGIGEEFLQFCRPLCTLHHKDVQRAEGDGWMDVVSVGV